MTSATERLARVRLAAGNVPVPERLVTAETVHEGKPGPAPYLAGAKLLGLRPEECVVFEDSASGVESGHRAGCTVIATMFSHEAEDLHRAEYLVADLSAVAVARVQGGLELRLRALERRQG